MRKWGQTTALVLCTGFLHAASLQTIQESLGVPDAFARVTDASLPDNVALPEFILIQDVHRHPEVQKQIAALILQGYNAWGVKKVFLEGAFTTLDLTMFHRVPKKTQTLLMERLVKDGELSGPELAAVMIMEREWRDPPASPFQIFGLDDPVLYRQNVAAYESVLSLRDRALAELVPIRRLQDSIHLSGPNRVDQQLNRMDALLHLKLKPSEYDAFLKDKVDVPSTPVLDPAVRVAEEFYRLVQLRSQTFLAQTMKKVPASASPRILVTGGFHTAYMAECLRRQGHSFVVLTPIVMSPEENPVYERRLKETSNTLAQAVLPVHP
jgi:hypothetical protein